MLKSKEINQDKPEGPYILWTYHRDDGWSFENFATLKEAIEHDTYGSAHVITRAPVDWSPVEENSGAVRS